MRADDESLIETAFDRLPQLGGRSQWRITALAGGFANRSFLLEAAFDRLVLRVPVETTAYLGVDRASEGAILSTVSAAGLAPPLVEFDRECGLMLAEYFDGRAWSAEDTRSPRAIERLARLIERLHAIDPPAEARRLDYAELLASYRRDLEAKDEALRSVSRKFDEEADRRLARVRAASLPTVLCHNDVHRRNLVDGPPLVLVDWEYAAAGDGLYDLASYACYHDLGLAERRFLLEGYDASRVPALASTFEDHCWLFDYMHLLWLQLTGSDAALEGRLARRLGPLGMS